MICVPPPVKHISFLICVPLPGKHIIILNYMCSPTWETHIPRDMCSLTWETHILPDMCSPTLETHIPTDMCAPTWETGKYIPLVICDPLPRKHISRLQVQQFKCLERLFLICSISLWYGLISGNHRKHFRINPSINA